MHRIRLISSSSVAALILLSSYAIFAKAEDCDCNQVVGSCTVTYKLLNIYNDPQKINSKAELQFTSSALACSKVEYFIDNTPYQTVLTNTNQGYESIYGTSTISGKTVQIQACKICGRGQGNPTAVITPPSGSTAEKLFNSALESPGVDSSQFTQTLQNRADNDSNLPAVGFAIEAANAVQQMRQNQQLPTSSTSPSYRAGNTIYENRGGLVDESAPSPLSVGKTGNENQNHTKPSSCPTCGVR
jgi:hypothetical protein